MNMTVGNHIAKEIGTPLLIDAPKNGLARGPFLCMRVDIDITKPLMRGKMVHIEDMERGGSILSMRDFLSFVIVVEF